MKYVPLNLHTEYSLLDGVIKIPEIYKFAAENDMPAIAITDNGVMYGCAEMFKVKKELLSQIKYDDKLRKKLETVRPIIGCEVYVIDGDISYKNYTNRTLYNLILLVKNDIGYNNLVKLVSISHLDGFYFKPRINNKLLDKYKEGLICLSSGIKSEIATKFLNGDKKEAVKIAQNYKNIFGYDYYIELQDHNLEEEKILNIFLKEIAERFDIKTVITNNSYYLKKQDAKIHDTILCERNGAKKNDTTRYRFPNNEFYVKTVDELKQSFPYISKDYFNKCIDTTVEIANKCNFEMKFERNRKYLPKYTCPNKLSEIEYLHELCLKGLKEKYPNILSKNIMNLYNQERKMVLKTGVASIFLVVKDILDYAKANKIQVGETKGKIFNSITAFALGITKNIPNGSYATVKNIENTKYNININIDKCMIECVIDYIIKKYGKEYTSKIISFTNYSDKTALKAISKIYNIESPKIKKSKKFIKEINQLSGIKNFYKENAFSVIISSIPIREIIPVQYSKYANVLTQYSKDTVEKIGFLKINFIKNKVL